jgi:hypothetical protein
MSTLPALKSDALQRALEKMGAFLRRRGVAVSAAALASGLHSEMASAASGMTPSAAAALGVRAVSITKTGNGDRELARQPRQQTERPIAR